MPGPRDSRFETRRRGVLASVGLLAGVRGSALAAGDRTDVEQTGEGASHAVVQGDRCVPVAPLSGPEPVEAVYDYRLPDRFVSDENGARRGPPPYFSSLGTRDRQRAGTSHLFLYDGPNGLSLVLLHGRIDDPGSGGAATFRFEGLPAAGQWVVRDDLYRDPTTGSLAATNYDRWSVDGGVHTVDWTWGQNTDGGAFRGLEGGAAVTIAPSFNETAALFGEHYDGTVEAWHVLSADGEDDGGVRRVQLDLETPVVVRPGDCSTGGDRVGSGADPPEGGPGREQTEHDREQRKHRKKQRKHQKKQRKHEKQQRKHEKQQRKHREKRQRKHQKKQRKHQKKQRKHQKRRQRKHQKKQRKHQKKQRKHRKEQQKHEK